MSWLAKLYETYEAGLLLTDFPDGQRLMPTSHTLQNAHINIVIDCEGNFKRASVLEKTQIVLPATEKSAGRSGKNPPPHPLADKLQYIAGNDKAFDVSKKKFHQEYEELLENWCTSVFHHPKAQAVLHYVKKGSVIRDLVGQGIVFVDDSQKMLTAWPYKDIEPPLLFKVLPKDKGSVDQGSALVCWTVQVEGDPNSETWKDKSLQDSWVAFDNAGDSLKGLCMVTGQEQSLSVNHPAKIRHSGDKAKLISSNDSSGYTYRGRFLEGGEACGVGFDVSQKAHNALRWLVARQGFRNGDQVFVSWAISGKAIPEPLQDSFSLFDNLDSVDLAEMTDVEYAAQQQTPAVNHAVDIGESFAHKLNKYMAGYRAQLAPNEQIVIMGLDSATPGRMGVTYYRELLGSDFLQRLQSWHTDFSWPQRHTRELISTTGNKPKTQVIWPVSSPPPKAIAEAAYGQTLPDTLKKNVIERLLPCIIDGSPFPIDLVNACVRKATNRVAYKNDEQWLWERNLGIACAVYKGYYQRHPVTNQRRTYTMALDEHNRSRDYLYGRLLAVAERIEEVALGVAGENRPTTAARLMQRFADRPFSTWRTIELALDPYMQRLQNSRPGFLVNRKKDLDAIHALFTPDDFTNEKCLTGEFLLGFHCQRQKLREKSETTTDNSTEGAEV